jgi:imidazolonepropionase-like amidohydrolase
VVGKGVLARCACAAAATAIGPSHAQSRACGSPPLLVRNVTQWTQSGPVHGRDVFVRDGVPSRTIAYRDNASLVEAPSNFEFLSPGDRDFVLSTARKDLGGAEPARSAHVLQSLPAKFAQLRHLRLTMAVGSDAGSTLHFPAGAIWWELEAWRSLGATHREALTAATEHGARVLRTADTGRLTVGARADFILYRGDVEQGPFEMARVLEVAKDGVRFVAGGRWVAN